MATTDTSAAIKAIRDLYCDPETAELVLSTLVNQYGDWLKAHDLIGHPAAPNGTGYEAMLVAHEQLGEFADWQRAVAKVAA